MSTPLTAAEEARAQEILVSVKDVYKSFRKEALKPSDLKNTIVNMLFMRSNKEARMVDVLKGVDFEIRRGETFGIIGRNGSGKSTLLKIMSGIYKPTSGSVDVNGRLSALIELGAGFHPEFTGRENIFINGIMLGLTRAEISDRIEQIISFSGLQENIDDPVKTYSSGMYMRLAFSVAINIDPEILVLDEILAVGDAEFIPRSFAAMDEFKRKGKTIILVTHDVGTVQNWCTRAAWLHDGRIREIGDTRKVVGAYMIDIMGAKPKRVEVAAEAKTEQAAPASEGAGGEAQPDVQSREADALWWQKHQIQPFDESVELDVEGYKTTGRRYGSGEIEITKISILNGDGEETKHFETSQSFTFVIDYTAYQQIEYPVFGVGIFHGDGQRIYGTNTDVEGVTPPVVLGPGRLYMHFESLNLLPGTYFFDVACHPKMGHPFDQHDHMHYAVFFSPIKDVGYFRPAHHWVHESDADVPV